ncbi:sensor histidine kinase, partial [Vibrio parahaemolyticus]
LGLVRYERNTDDSPVRTISEQELHNIVALSQAQADEKSLEFNVQILGHPQTKATTAVLNITLSNLIRNGIAATSAGTIHITMTYTSLSVRDEGEGFSSVPDAEGHGLGLMIVDDLCRRYGWQFTIDTHPNDGCVATIDLSTEVTDGESQDEEM